MRKYFYVALVAVLSIGLVSWGYVGHQTVARIAENHLTPKAKEAVKALLGTQSLSDVASWADEVRNDPEYKSTAPWHFLNLPLGLSHTAFDKTVIEMGNENIYTALMKSEQVLTQAGSTPQQKVDALKFIVHLVGDAHQPMHISRAEDKGGNTIQVQFDGRGTNLHSLWDSRLIDKQGLSYAEIAKKFDTATPTQIREWQSDSPMQWIWESYEISSKLYAEVDKGNKLDDAYYNSHIGIINERLEKAGIRLAGVLNKIFERADLSALKVKAAVSAPKAQESTIVEVQLTEIGKHLEESVSTQGKVYGIRDMGSFILVNLGGEYPNQLLTVLLRGEAKSLAKDIDGKTIAVTGKVMDYKGKPEIVVTQSSNIHLVTLVGASTHIGGE